MASIQVRPYCYKFRVSPSTGPLDGVMEQRAQQKHRAVAVYECDCSDQVDPSADDMIQCKRKRCETIRVTYFQFNF